MCTTVLPWRHALVGTGNCKWMATELFQRLQKAASVKDVVVKRWDMTKELVAIGGGCQRRVIYELATSDDDDSTDARSSSSSTRPIRSSLKRRRFRTPAALS